MKPLLMDSEYPEVRNMLFFHGDSFSKIIAVSGLLSSQNKTEKLKITRTETALDTDLATQNERSKTQFPWCPINLRNTIEKLNSQFKKKNY